MTANDEFFTPEEIDEQIDLLSRKPDQRQEADMQAARVLSHLRQFYVRNDQKHIDHLEHAWERVIEEHQLKKQITQGKGRNVHTQEYQVESQEVRALNSKQKSSKKRAFARQLSLLAAVVIIGVLAGSMALILNMARQAHNDRADQLLEISRDGKNYPKSSHSITSGPCTIDTTVPHQQQSKTSIPGLYVVTNNQVNNVLYRYDTHTQKVVWSKKLCSQFSSNGTVEEHGVLYLAGTDTTLAATKGMKSYLYAFNETDGSVLWGVEFPTMMIPTDLGGIEMPTIANGIIYVMQRTGIVYAFDATTGGQLWTFDTGRNVLANGFGGGSLIDPPSIQVVNGIAYGVIVDRVFALDARSGKKLWMHSFSDKLNINQAPAIANGTIYLTAYVPGQGPTGNIYAFNAQTGTQMWATPKMPGYLEGPIPLNGKVYAMSYDNMWYTVNSSNGTIEAQKLLTNTGSGPRAINGTLYTITDTTLTALNPDGSTMWSVSVTGDGNHLSIDDVKSRTIYISGRESGIYAYSTANGSFLGHYNSDLLDPEGIPEVTIVG